jgi:pyruvate dehydrogenase E2 component (dihydrolipoamide acetyltransferase)
MIEFKLPTLGADMDEGKLIEWKVKPGDQVKRGDVVAVVDTTKAAVDVEIWDEGTMHELIVQPGTKIPVGTVLALLLAPGENPETAVRPKIAPPGKPEAAARAPAPVAAPAAAVAEAERRRVSPAARRHAEELGVNLDAVKGTGPGGSVTFEDVERLRAEAPAPDKRAEMRKAIAAAMSRSKREIPHYYLSETIPMLRASEWLARENEKRPLTARILMAVLQLKAVALALKGFPDLNGFWREGGYQPSSAIHVGVAISLRGGGLIAPAIHDVPEMPLNELMASLADLVKRARAGSLRSSEMSDPTITVTNLGEGSVDSTFAIIYPPQVAIVGFGRIAPRPWVEGDTVRAVPTVIASVSGDHRASDGHRGALLLAEIARLLQEPEKL